jgi:hypothetical protein
MKYIKRTKRISTSPIKKKWPKWLKLYNEVVKCLNNRKNLEQYRDTLQQKLIVEKIFEHDIQLRKNAINVLAEMFNKYILENMPSLKGNLSFRPEKVIIEKVRNKDIKCFYSEDDVYIRYEGYHAVNLDSISCVRCAFVDYLTARVYDYRM